MCQDMDWASCCRVSRKLPPPQRMSPMDTLAFIISFFFISVSGLQITELAVPTHADIREAATLVCHYDLENATLNSVKWYKDEREFFRYIPGTTPPTKAFPAPGISLDLSPSKSYDTQVTLRPLVYNTSGTFRCEVSADAPKFETVHQESNMTVMALPRERPSIHGVAKHYNVGDTIRVNCTSDKSFPASTLQWSINGHTAQHWQLVHHNPRDRPDNPLGLQSSTLGLSFTLGSKDFPSARLELRCLSSISSVPSLTLESTAIIERDSNQKLAQRASSASLAATLSPVVLATLLHRPWC